MSTTRERIGGAMLHPELRAEGDPDAIIRDGRRLDHAEAASKPLPPSASPRTSSACRWFMTSPSVNSSHRA